MTRGSKFLVFAGIAVTLTALLSPFASKSPDGLEKIAHDQGFAERGEQTAARRFAVAPGYAIPGVRNEYVATSAAGVLGAAMVFGVAFGVGKIVSRKHPAQDPRERP